MNERERLIELLSKSFNVSDDNYGIPNIEQVADNLLENSVVVLPCKVGDTLYFINRALDGEICEAEVIKIEINYYTPTNPLWLLLEVYSHRIGKFEHHSRTDLLFGKTLFQSREDAEKALKGGATNEAN